ncbi:hypothetical protein LINPERHAP2_LOCUS10542 [Linum perenne]
MEKQIYLKMNVLLFMMLLLPFFKDTRAASVAGHAKKEAGGGMLMYRALAASSVNGYKCVSPCYSNEDCKGCGGCACETRPHPFCDNSSCFCYYCPPNYHHPPPHYL